MLHFLLVRAAMAAAQTFPPPGIDCQRKTVVYYKAGPNWDKARDYTEPHLRYLADLLKKGVASEAGPNDDKGGLLVYNSTDPAEVDAWVLKDPLVANGVVVWTRSGWTRCVVAPPSGR